MIFDRRDFLLACGTSVAFPSLLSARTAETLRPEDFGALGDGMTNDSKAFARLSAEVNRRGGGSITLGSRRTYIVGAQVPGGSGRFGWNPLPILDFEDLTLPLQIAGNGARLRCQSGLRFGTFDPASGARIDRPMPNLKRSEVATPYLAMIRVAKCRAAVAIRDIELDGNVERLIVGGKYGDKGWQIPSSGLLLLYNYDGEVVENVFAHHQALDGAMFRGDPDRASRSSIRRLVCRNNGRQGLSITGGRGYDFASCEFSRTGRSAIRSAPGAGVDIEAEATLIRDLTFTGCKFLDNVGCGVVANKGNSEDVRFRDCLFVGTTSWSAWPRKPAFSFTRCTFVGALIHGFADPDPARATRFVSCRFTDDPKLSPGAVFAGRRGEGPIVSFVKSDNIRFEKCSFDLVGMAVLPLTRGAIYKDCRMVQRSSHKARPRGRFLGTTTISGPVNLAGSLVEGDLFVNGRRIPRGHLPSGA